MRHPKFNKREMMKTLVRALFAALCLAALAIPATASSLGPLGQQWDASSSGFDPYGMGNTLTISGDTLSYSFNHPGDAWDGVPEQSYVFSTTAAANGPLDLSINTSSFASWYEAFTDMYVWEGSTANSQFLAGDTWGGVQNTLVTLNLTSGEAWGFSADGGNYDGTGAVSGSFSVTQVPEPKTLALLGLGLLALVFANRKKA
jgi:hypothetical protein